MFTRFIFFLIRCVFCLFRLLPEEWWRMIMGGKILRYEGRQLQSRAHAFARLVGLRGAPTSDKDINHLRLAYDLGSHTIDGPPVPMAQVLDKVIALNGRDLAARLYDFDRLGATKGLILYFHGGGFVIGGLKSHEQVCRRLAKYSGMRVLAVDYRMGPEHRFPAAVEDACDCWDWVQENAASLNIDPAKVAVAGDSAGGNLSMVVGNYTTSHPDKGKPSALGLVYPLTDATLEDERSLTLAGFELILGEKIMTWFRDRYKPTSDGGADDLAIMADPRISPLKDTDNLMQWPPAMLITCGFDPLRPGGERLRDLLQAHDRPLVYKEYEGLFHGFISMATIFDEAEDMTLDLARFLDRPEDSLL